MPPDVHWLLEREAQQVNATVLLNLQAYADLTTRLYTGMLPGPSSVEGNAMGLIRTENRTCLPASGHLPIVPSAWDL